MDTLYRIKESPSGTSNETSELVSVTKSKSNIGLYIILLIVLIVVIVLGVLVYLTYSPVQTGTTGTSADNNPGDADNGS